MAHYYFDLKFDGEPASRDEEGMELVDVEAAEIEAAYSLGDFAREAVRSKKHLSKLQITVRDDDGVVLTAEISFKLKRLH